MAKVTMWFGLALVVLGVVAYVGSGMDSVTALLPALLGLVLAGLGFVGQAEDKRALTMHIAAVVALIGLLGTLGRLVPALVGDGDVAGWAVAGLTGTFILLGAYMVLSVRSFIAASKARKARTA
jgi:FtsH-binding integral membrane protein